MRQNSFVRGTQVLMMHKSFVSATLIEGDIIVLFRAGEPEIFSGSSFFSSGSGSGSSFFSIGSSSSYFLQLAPASAPKTKNMRLRASPALNFLLSLAFYQMKPILLRILIKNHPFRQGLYPPLPSILTRPLKQNKIILCSPNNFKISVKCMYMLIRLFARVTNIDFFYKQPE